VKVNPARWWWEGYASLAWSLTLVGSVFSSSDIAGVVFVVAFILSPVGLMLAISALRIGSVAARVAAVLALVLAALFVNTFILHPIH
jgi:hypothetical protein